MIIYGQVCSRHLFFLPEICLRFDPSGISRNEPACSPRGRGGPGSKLHRQIANVRKDFLHQVSNDISKNHVVVCIEDLQVKNMSKRATKKAAQTSGLNRSVWDASPFELRRQLEYKTQWQGGLLVPVPAQNTSRQCPECEHGAAENRKSQAKFVCRSCGFSANADWVGAVNIREAGLASLACWFASGEVSPSCQEPTEGIPA